MSNKDVFADLFASSSSKKNDVSKLTLAERLKISLNQHGNNKQNSFVGLDFLSSATSNSSVDLINGSSKTNGTNIIHKNNNNISLIGESFSTLLPKRRDSNVKINRLNQHISASNNLNGNIANTGRAQSATAIEKRTTQDLDALFAVFDGPEPLSSSSVPSSTNFNADVNFVEAMETKSEIPPRKPQRPSILKFQDHNASNKETSSLSRSLLSQDKFNDHQASLNDHLPKNTYTLSLESSTKPMNLRNLFDDLSTNSTFHSNKNSDLVADTASELFNSASILFAKGKQALNKNIEKYQAQRKAERSGSPAWMYYNTDEKRRREISRNHKTNGNDWDIDMNFDDEEVIDFDGSVLSNRKPNSGKQSLQQECQAPKPPSPPQRKKPDVTLASKIVANSDTKHSETNRETVEASQLVNLLDDFSITSSQQGLPRVTAKDNVNTKVVNNSLSILDSATLAKFNSLKKSGGEFFKEGNFTEALNYYQKAQLCSVQDSKIQLLAFSNLCTTYMKLGDTSNVILNADRALKLIDDRKIFIGEENNNCDLENVLIPESNRKNAKEFFVKIHGKKAEAFELNDKYDLALKEWKIVLENGGANKNSIEGKRRCLEALGQVKKKAAIVSQGNSRKSRTGLTDKGVSEAVKRVKENNEEQERLEQEKYLLYDTVEQKINSWKHGKEDNIRALLVSLDQVLWSDMNWKPVKLNDLIMEKKVRICYMKAVAKTHPDKMGKNFSTEQKLVAQQVFVTLNKAWDLFKEQNGIN